MLVTSRLHHVSLMPRTRYKIKATSYFYRRSSTSYTGFLLYTIQRSGAGIPRAFCLYFNRCVTLPWLVEAKIVLAGDSSRQCVEPLPPPPVPVVSPPPGRRRLRACVTPDNSITLHALGLVEYLAVLKKKTFLWLNGEI